MGVSYSFYLRVGFKIPTDDLKALFKQQLVTNEAGVFHMEDRFDPKTGAKIEPVKVWDKKPKTNTETWWVIDGERFDDWEDDPMTRVFEEKIGCHVDAYWQAHGDDWAFGFYPHDPGDKDIDEGKFSINNTSMTYQKVKDLEPQLKEIKQKLQALGIKVGEPEIFIGEISG